MWTEERTNRATTMWLNGESATEIANALGQVTRCGVIGKMHRLGLARFSKATWSPKPRPKRRTNTEAATAREALKRIAQGELPSKPLPRTKAWNALPGSSPVSLVDLESGMCRWPIGDDKPYLFCGCPTVPGGSYCATHKATSSTVFPANNTPSILANDTSKNGLGPAHEAAFGRVVATHTQELSTA